MRQPAQNSRVRYTVARSPLGCVLVAATERGVCHVALGDRPDALVRDLRRRFPDSLPATSELRALARAIVRSIEDPRRRPDLPLDVRGSPFQRRVWATLRRIPPGATVTYGELARRIGLVGGARAVARACAANPVAVLIPCHRVVRADGEPGGYRWGSRRKRWLLRVEREPGR